MDPFEKRRLGPIRPQNTALVAYPEARGQVNYECKFLAVWCVYRELEGGCMAYIVARIRSTNPFDIPHGPDIYRSLG